MHQGLHWLVAQPLFVRVDRGNRQFRLPRQIRLSARLDLEPEVRRVRAGEVGRIGKLDVLRARRSLLLRPAHVADGATIGASTAPAPTDS